MTTHLLNFLNLTYYVAISFIFSVCVSVWACECVCVCVFRYIYFHFKSQKSILFQKVDDFNPLIWSQ